MHRKWLKDVWRALLFVTALGVLGYGWYVWDNGQEGYRRVRVGMSSTEAEAILEERGYTVVGGDGNARESVLVYQRHKTEPPIVLIFGSDGRLKKKEQDSLVEYILQSLHDALH
jgi:hypothetical protein